MLGGVDPYGERPPTRSGGARSRPSASYHGHVPSLSSVPRLSGIAPGEGLESFASPRSSSFTVTPMLGLPGEDAAATYVALPLEVEVLGGTLGSRTTSSSAISAPAAAASPLAMPRPPAGAPQHTGGRPAPRGTGHTAQHPSPGPSPGSASAATAGFPPALTVPAAGAGGPGTISPVRTSPTNAPRAPLPSAAATTAAGPRGSTAHQAAQGIPVVMFDPAAALAAAEDTASGYLDPTKPATRRLLPPLWRASQAVLDAAGGTGASDAPATAGSGASDNSRASSGSRGFGRAASILSDTDVLDEQDQQQQQLAQLAGARATGGASEDGAGCGTGGTASAASAHRHSSMHRALPPLLGPGWSAGSADCSGGGAAGDGADGDARGGGGAGQARAPVPRSISTVRDSPSGGASSLLASAHAGYSEDGAGSETDLRASLGGRRATCTNAGRDGCAMVLLSELTSSRSSRSFVLPGSREGGSVPGALRAGGGGHEGAVLGGGGGGSGRSSLSGRPLLAAGSASGAHLRAASAVVPPLFGGRNAAVLPPISDSTAAAADRRQSLA